MPDASCRAGADGALVPHRDTGATDHDFKSVALHELGERAPQGQNHAAVPMVGMHAAATELNHAAAQAAQARQVKFEVRIETAHPGGLLWREHAVGSYDRTARAIAH